VKAESLSREDVELLWRKKLLGDATPQSLLDTVVFMNGLFFALRSGKEHRQLRFDPPQIKVVENDGERSYLIYTEDISKNRPGGLKGRKQKPKVVIQLQIRTTFSLYTYMYTYILTYVHMCM